MTRRMPNDTAARMIEAGLAQHSASGSMMWAFLRERVSAGRRAVRARLYRKSPVF